MTRQQRSRLITAAGFLLLLATILNLGRTDGWIEAVKISGLLVALYGVLVLIMLWERRGKP